MATKYDHLPVKEEPKKLKLKKKLELLKSRNMKLELGVVCSSLQHL